MRQKVSFAVLVRESARLPDPFSLSGTHWKKAD